MSKLPTPAKLALLGAVVVIALVAGWFVAIAPKRSDAAKLATQIGDTRAQIAAREASRSQPPATAPAIRVADLFRLSRAMPNRADVPGVLLQLSRVAVETGVVFQSITPHDPVQLGFYQQIGINLVFEGRFYDLSDFLYRLRNLVGVHEGVLNATGRLFSVDSISFDQGTLQFPQVKATLTISAFVFGDGTAAPVPTATSALSAASLSTPVAESSQPIPAAPPGATAAGT
jgi:type IV pilus assembly PilO-like protein